VAVLWLLIAAPKALGAIAVEAGAVSSCASMARDIGSRIPATVNHSRHCEYRHRDAGRLHCRDRCNGMEGACRFVKISTPVTDLTGHSFLPCRAFVLNEKENAHYPSAMFADGNFTFDTDLRSATESDRISPNVAVTTRSKPPSPRIAP
jgi:hypothetical protein